LHQHGHSVDKPPEVVVEVLDVVGDQAERRVAVLADLREGKPTPSFDLGLLTSVFLRLVIVLVVVLVVVIVMFVVRHSGGQCRDST
jgi:heme/copper-type cytochrome/quinol oxidase subunit 2